MTITELCGLLVHLGKGGKYHLLVIGYKDGIQTVQLMALLVTDKFT